MAKAQWVQNLSATAEEYNRIEPYPNEQSKINLKVNLNILLNKNERKKKHSTSNIPFVLCCVTIDTINISLLSQNNLVFLFENILPILNFRLIILRIDTL